MLICNLISERYNILRKDQYGIKYCLDTLYSMYLQQLGLELGCTGVVICYQPEICEDNSIDCSDITVTQSLTSTCTSAITITQL